MDNNPDNAGTQDPVSKTSADSKYTWISIGFFWVLSLIIVGYVGFIDGKGDKVNSTQALKKVAGASTSLLPGVPIQSPTPQTGSVVQVTSMVTPSQNAPTGVSTAPCARSGYAQKWEYLTPYTIKNGDTIQSIAQEQLNDSTRVNEILQLNGNSQLVVGSTLYLPPPQITKSNGNIQQIYGKLLEINSSFWHVGFSSDPNGLGVLVPTYWFDGIQNIDTYQTGDCVKVLLDNGDKVYSVSEQ